MKLSWPYPLPLRKSAYVESSFGVRGGSSLLEVGGPRTLPHHASTPHLFVYQVWLVRQWSFEDKMKL